MTTDGWGWTSLVRINPSINWSQYWLANVWTELNWYYNYMNKSWLFNVTEVYVNKTVGWDGSEFHFEKVWNDLYSRRWLLTDRLIMANWYWLGVNLNNWVWIPSANPDIIDWVSYMYFWHNNADCCSDFPFFVNIYTGTSPNDTLFSDNAWWGREYFDNVTANIFVR